MLKRIVEVLMMCKLSVTHALPLILLACGGSARSKPATIAELQAREATECAGIDLADRSQNLLAENVARVDPLVEERTTKRTYGYKVGAVVTVRAEPALTAEWLQRRLECYVAHSRARGFVATNDPLLVPGAVVHVRSAGDRFAVAIRSEDLDDARVILERAERLETTAIARP